MWDSMILAINSHGRNIQRRAPFSEHSLVTVCARIPVIVLVVALCKERWKDWRDVIEVIVCITPALAASVSFALWTMLEWLVSVSYVLEEVYLILFREERSTQTVYWCISPTLIVETAFWVQVFKVFLVCLSSPEIKVSNLKVAPPMAKERE